MWSTATVLALGAMGCTIEARVGSGPVEPVNWQTSNPTGRPAPAPAPMPNPPPPQTPGPQAPAPAPTHHVVQVPTPAPSGGTQLMPVPVARASGAFGGPNQNAALRGLVYYIPESTMTMPDVSTMKPSAVVFTDTLDVDQRDYTQGIAGTNRLEFYAIRYDGTFNVAKAGKFNFRLASSDGSKLYIDDKLVVDNDGRHLPLLRASDVTLAAGQHTIRVDFFKAYRWVVQLRLTVIPEGGTEHPWTKNL
jgi:hypothetical protein